MTTIKHNFSARFYLSLYDKQQRDSTAIFCSRYILLFYDFYCLCASAFSQSNIVSTSLYTTNDDAFW